jgi:hypothetical protein
MHKYIVVAAALAMTLGLAGCSGDKGSSQAGTAEGETTITASATPKPKPVENVDKTWTFDYEGAKGTFKLAADPSNSEVAAIEAARSSVNGETVTLIPVEVDNTAGTSSINMYGLTIVTKDGKQVSSVSLSDYFQKWRDAAGDDTDKYNALVDAETQHGQFDLQPGAKGTALVAFAAPVTSAWRVTVMPAGAGAGAGVEATAK